VGGVHGGEASGDFGLAAPPGVRDDVTGNGKAGVVCDVVEGSERPDDLREGRVVWPDPVAVLVVREALLAAVDAGDRHRSNQSWFVEAPLGRGLEELHPRAVSSPLSV